jgi:tyrosyl-tRNA synthetase
MNHPKFADEAYLFDGFAHIETVDDIRTRLKPSGPPLRVKLGIDPTSPDLHLGFVVVLNKLQRFAEVGHRVTLIIGDFTAKIGDPSGRKAARPQLSDEEIERNMQTYRQQAGKVLDLDRVQIRYNSEWLGKLGAAELINLLAKTTVAQMLERNDFRDRYSSGDPISLHELLYPVAQAYDSVAIQADIELGAVDQLFNLLLGRHYQRELGQLPQICAMTPLLIGLDGAMKMSKSLGNYIGIAEAPETQFGKLMSMPDELMPAYARNVQFWQQDKVDRLATEIRDDPMQAKKRLAEEIVARFHGTSAAQKARDYFERTVQRKELPGEGISEIQLLTSMPVSAVMVKAGFAESRRAAERLIAGNGVKIDGRVVSDPKASWPGDGPAVLSVGARKFVRVLPQRR